MTQRALLASVVFASALALSSTAQASTFDVSGTLTAPLPPLPGPPPSSTPFSGTMTIDTTGSNGVTAADIAVQGFSHDFTSIIINQGITAPSSPGWEVKLSDGVNDSLTLIFAALQGMLIPNPSCDPVSDPFCSLFLFTATLDGFTGSQITGGSFVENGADTLDSVSGIISPATTTGATLLPAALPLFATGIGGLGLLGWRRKRKAQATA